MALGGGTFAAQNKVLPGAYINFVSAARVDSSQGERGIVTMPLELDWGIDGEVFEITAEGFKQDAMKFFGYAYTDDKLKGLRDLFLYTRKAYFYRLNSGAKASNNFATAKCSGTRGNDLKVVISANVDNESAFDVKLYLDAIPVDSQTVETAAALVDNDYVVWKKSATLAATAGTALAGGTNGTTVNGASYQQYLNKIESYSYHVMASYTAEDSVKALLTAFCKRMRDEAGIKFQLVVHDLAADYEGVINVKNSVDTTGGDAVTSLVYWVAGVCASCAINKSALNMRYDGEFTVLADYTQVQLEAAIKAGEFALHRCNNDLRVLADINSLVTETAAKGVDFKSNQTIRIIDKIGNDIATLFAEKYIGGVANNESGRVSLWADIVKHHKALQDMGVIENFNDQDIVVSAGNTKKSVVINDVVTVVNAMSQLYMTVTVA